MPLAPRLESTRGGASRAGKNVSTSRTGIEEATTSTASGGSRTPSSAATRGSERARARRGRDRFGRRPVGAAPVLQPAALLARRLRRQHARVGGDDRRHRAGRVLPRVLGVEGDLQRAVEPVQPLAQRLRGREVADAQHEVGRVGGPVGVAQQRVVVRDRRRAAAGAGERVGQQRQRERVGERGERLAQPGVALAAAGDDHAARVVVDRGAQPVEQRRRGGEPRARPRHPRPPAGAPAAAGLLLRQRGVEHERLAQREVEVDRAGAAVDARSRTRGRRAGAASACAPAWPGGRRPRGTTWRRCRRA